jgi:hypothetical protein
LKLLPAIRKYGKVAAIPVVSQTVNRYQHHIGHVLFTDTVATRAPPRVARRYFIVRTQRVWLSDAKLRMVYFICLFVFDLTTLQVAQPFFASNARMINEWERCEMKRLWPNLRRYPRFCQEGLRKTMENFSRDCLSPVRDLNPGSP